MVVGPPLHPGSSDGGKASRREMQELTGRLEAELQRLYDEAQKKAGVRP
jgi:hypothetical protein